MFIPLSKYCVLRVKQSMIYTEEIIRNSKFDLCGIYKIELNNNNNNLYYIGSAVDMRKRWMKHISMMKIGKHHNAIIRDLYNSKVIRELSFTVVELCEPSEIKELEEKLIQFDDPKCVNITKLHHGGDIITKHPHKNQISEKLRKPKFISKVSINGSVYASFLDASRNMGLPESTIRYRTKSNKFSEYKYISE